MRLQAEGANVEAAFRKHLFKNPFVNPIPPAAQAPMHPVPVLPIPAPAPRSLGPSPHGTPTTRALAPHGDTLYTPGIAPRSAPAPGQVLLAAAPPPHSANGDLAQLEAAAAAAGLHNGGAGGFVVPRGDGRAPAAAQQGAAARGLPLYLAAPNGFFYAAPPAVAAAREVPYDRARPFSDDTARSHELPHPRQHAGPPTGPHGRHTYDGAMPFGPAPPGQAYVATGALHVSRAYDVARRSTHDGFDDGAAMDRRRSSYGGDILSPPNRHGQRESHNDASPPPPPPPPPMPPPPELLSDAERDEASEGATTPHAQGTSAPLAPQHVQHIEWPEQRASTSGAAPAEALAPPQRAAAFAMEQLQQRSLPPHVQPYSHAVLDGHLGAGRGGGGGGGASMGYLVGAGGRHAVHLLPAPHGALMVPMATGGMPQHRLDPTQRAVNLNGLTRVHNQMFRGSAGAVVRPCRA